MFQALASVDIGSLICNVGAGGAAPAPAAGGAAPAAGGEAPGKCSLGLFFIFLMCTALFLYPLETNPMFCTNIRACT